MTIRIAVIGSGIAGLTAAYLLNRVSSFSVTLFESSKFLGMDAQRLDLPKPEGGNVSVDVPSRMFNDGQWPSLVRLYDQIGVRSSPVDASQSFTIASQRELYLKLPSVMNPAAALRQAIRKKPRSILSEASRLLATAKRDLRSGVGDLTLTQYLDSRKFADEFISEFLYPTLSSTVCTCSYESLGQYPAEIVLNAIASIAHGQTLMRTTDGTADVVRRLCEGLSDVRLSCPVESVREQDDSISIRSNGQSDFFDHVVVATQANTAANLLPDNCRESHVLQSIVYEDVSVFVHSDQGLMPKKKGDWATFNMIAGTESAACTVWLNRFYGDGRFANDLFQTIDVGLDLTAKDVRCEATLQRPTVTNNSLRALKEIDAIHNQPGQRIWFCGSWAAAGIPLLETGVQSAEGVARRIRESVSVAT